MRKWLLGLAFLLVFLTACSGSQEIKVTFIENGGNEVKDITIKTTDKDINLPTPIRDDYEFIGWFTDEALTKEFSLAVLLSQQTSITLYAKWALLAQSFTITFNENGGSNVTDQNYNNDAITVAPTNPTKQGHTFVGWFSDESLSTAFTFGSALSADLTLYAKWSINTYTISFEENGGSSVTDIVANYDTTITEPIVPERIGYTFLGWYSDSALLTPYVFDKMGDSNITLYAKWSINQYAVTFNTNGGSSLDPQNFTYDSTIQIESETSRLGYTFGGWYMDNELLIPFTLTKMPNNPITLYAKWVINQYEITFDSVGGSTVLSIVKNYQESITEPTAPTKLGYDFRGWYSDQTYQTPYVFNNMGSTSVTLYAKWTASPYTISFNENGGSETPDIHANYGDTITEPVNPTKEGHTFLGWYSDTQFTTPYTFSTMPIGGVALYANWQVNNYNVTFIENGGSELTDLALPFGSMLTEPTVPTKLGYTFVGWFSDETLNTPYVFTQMGSTHITLYAKWIISSYTISFEENGGSVVTDITTTYDTVITSPVNPTKEGHTFIGWYSDSALLTPYVFDKMGAANLTLYAKWVKNTYTISRIVEGSLIEVSYLYGDTILAIETPTMQGYQFTGWYEGETLFNLTQMPARDITLMPQFTVLQYQIHFGNITRDSISLNYNETINLVVPYKQGHLFVGWFIDELLLDPFTSTHMPSEDVTLYAKFVKEVYNLYLMDGLDVIDLIDLEYGQSITLEIPAKSGFVFLGWFREIEFYNEVQVFTMYDQHTALYAKFVADEGFTPIRTIIDQNLTTVSVRGIISYIFPRVEFPGFYLFDGTANIFVKASPSPYEVGDVVSFDATYSLFENTPQLTDITNLLLDDTVYSMPGVTPYTLEEIPYFNETNTLYYGQRVALEGMFISSPNGPVLQEPFGDRFVAINFRSFETDMAIMPYINTTISFEAYIHDYDTTRQLWHLAIIVDSIVSTPLTDQDIIDQIILLGITNLNNQVFYSSSELHLPSYDAQFNATLQFETIGENASYFNVSTGLFLETDIDRMIELSCTVTVNGLSETVVFTIILKATGIISYEVFLDLPVNSYARLKGIVVEHISYMMLTVLYVDGYYLLVGNNQPVNPGDEAIFEGYKMEEDILMLANDPHVALVEIVSTNNPLPYLTYPISVETFITLPGDDSLYWFRSFKMTGFLQYDETFDLFYLIENEFTTPILVMDYIGYEMLNLYVGLTIEITGFSLPNFDIGGNLHFAFMNHPEHIQPASLTVQETMDLVFETLALHHNQHVYTTGDLIYLPDIDERFNVAISYAHYMDSDTYIDLISKSVIYGEIYRIVELEVTLSYQESTSLYHLYIYIEPNGNNNTISWVLTLDPDVLASIEVTVLYTDIGSVIVFDQTGTLYVETNRVDLHPGDRILISGYKVDSNMKYFTNPDTDTVVEILSHGNPLLSPIPMGLQAFLLLNMDDYHQHLIYIELEGTLLYDEVSNSYYLSNGMDEVMIFSPNSEHQLSGYLGSQITINGLSNPGEFGPELVFLGGPSDITGEINKTEIVNQAFFDIMDKNYNTYRPLESVYLPNSYLAYPVEITYLAISNGSLIDLTTKKVLDTVTEPAYIEIEVTITYMDYTDTFMLIISVEPVLISSISDVLGEIPGVTITIEGIIIYQTTDHTIDFMIIKDDTAQILVEGKYFNQLGDKVRITGQTKTRDNQIAIGSFGVDVLVIEEMLALPIAPTMTIEQANYINITLQENYYLYVDLVGYVWYNGETFYLTSDFGGGFEIGIIPTYESYMLFEYEMTKVHVTGFLTYDSAYDANGLLFTGHSSHVGQVYANDSEKMDDLIAIGYMQYESRVYHPFETIEMPLTFDRLGATLSYQILTNASYLDENNQIIQITEPMSISLEVTATIGNLVEVINYYIDVEPYEVTNISDLYMLPDDTFVKITGIVLVEGDFYYIIQDDTGMIYIEGYSGLNVGDIANIYGHTNLVYSTVYLNGFTFMSRVEVLGYDQAIPMETESTIYDTYYIEPMYVTSMYYTTLKGLLINFEGAYYITDGLYKIQIVPLNYDGELTLESYANIQVNIKVYFLSTEYYPEAHVRVLFTNLMGEISLRNMTAGDILDEMITYITHSFEQIYRPGFTYSYPITHPYFGGSYEIINDSIDSNVLMFTEGMLSILNVTSSHLIPITILTTYNGVTDSISTNIYVEPFEIYTVEEVLFYEINDMVTFKGVIVAMNYHYDTFVYIYDGTGVFIIIDMSNSLHAYLGQEILITARLENGFLGDIYFAYEYHIEQIGEEAVLEEPMYVHYGYILLDGNFNRDAMYHVVQIDGTVLVDGEQVYLMNYSDKMLLVGNTALTHQALLSQNGQFVTVTGIVLGSEGYDEFGNPRVLFALIDQA